MESKGEVYEEAGGDGRRKRKMQILVWEGLS
jgi:hypothetical protein